MQQQVAKHYELADLAEGESLASLEANNRNLENQLKKLTQVQEAFTIDYNNYKSSKQKLMSQLESLGFELIELESQRDKLHRYSETDISSLQESMNEFSQMLDEQQGNLAKMQSQYKVLSKSTETFHAITLELYELLRIISTDLQESHLREIGLLEIKQQLAKSEAKMNNLLTSGVMMKLSSLQSQLAMQNNVSGSLKKQQKGNRMRIL